MGRKLSRDGHVVVAGGEFPSGSFTNIGFGMVRFNAGTIVRHQRYMNGHHLCDPREIQRKSLIS